MPGLSRRGLLLGPGAAAGAGAAALAGGGLAPGALASSQPAMSAAEFGTAGDGRRDDSDALEQALQAAFQRGRRGSLVIPPGVYRVRRPLEVRLGGRRYGKLTRQCRIGGHGATLLSESDDGRPVLTIESRTTARYVLIDGLQIQGRGREGHGIVVSCQKRGTYFYNFCLRDVVVQGCGGDGLHMVGNVFEGQIFNGYFRDNGRDGASFSHGDEDTVLSSVHVVGSVFGGNGRFGAHLRGGAQDVGFHGCYFLLNGAFGLVGKHGTPLLSHCGFENNHRHARSFAEGDAGCYLEVGGTLVGCTAYSIYQQTHLLRAYVTNELNLVGCVADGGGKAKGARLARIDGRPSAQVTLVGCRGGVDRDGGPYPVEIGNAGGGVRMGGDWDSGALPQLGEHHLWVDRDGNLRIKKGRPHADDDGRPVGLA